MPTVNRSKIRAREARVRLHEAKQAIPQTIAEAMAIAEVKHESMPDRQVADIWHDLNRPGYDETNRERWILVRCINWGINVDRIRLPYVKTEKRVILEFEEFQVKPDGKNGYTFQPVGKGKAIARPIRKSR